MHSNVNDVYDTIKLTSVQDFFWNREMHSNSIGSCRIVFWNSLLIYSFNGICNDFFKPHQRIGYYVDDPRESMFQSNNWSKINTSQCGTRPPQSNWALWASPPILCNYDGMSTWQTSSYGCYSSTTPAKLDMTHHHWNPNKTSVVPFCHQQLKPPPPATIHEEHSLTSYDIEPSMISFFFSSSF